MSLSPSIVPHAFGTPIKTKFSGFEGSSSTSSLESSNSSTNTGISAVKGVDSGPKVLVSDSGSQYLNDFLIEKFEEYTEYKKLVETNELLQTGINLLRSDADPNLFSANVNKLIHCVKKYKPNTVEANMMIDNILSAIGVNGDRTRKRTKVQLSDQVSGRAKKSAKVEKVMLKLKTTISLSMKYYKGEDGKSDGIEFKCTDNEIIGLFVWRGNMSRLISSRSAPELTLDTKSKYRWYVALIDGCARLTLPQFDEVPGENVLRIWGVYNLQGAENDGDANDGCGESKCEARDESKYNLETVSNNSGSGASTRWINYKNMIFPYLDVKMSKLQKCNNYIVESNTMRLQVKKDIMELATIKELKPYLTPIMMVLDGRESKLPTKKNDLLKLCTRWMSMLSEIIYEAQSSD